MSRIRDRALCSCCWQFDARSRGVFPLEVWPVDLASRLYPGRSGRRVASCRGGRVVGLELTAAASRPTGGDEVGAAFLSPVGE